MFGGMGIAAVNSAAIIDADGSEHLDLNLEVRKSLSY